MVNRFQYANVRVNIVSVLGVGCLVILALSILFPVVPGGSGRARSTACASNLKQIGLGLVQYTQDYDGKLPNVTQRGSGTQTWRTAIFPYIRWRQVFLCPSRTQFDALDGFAISYAANDSGVYRLPAGSQGLGAFAPAGAKALTMADYPNPANLISVCEITGTASYDFDADDSARFLNGNGKLWAGHESQCNILLADGHIRRCAPLKTMSYIDPSDPAYPKNLWYSESSNSLSKGGQDAIRRSEP